MRIAAILITVIAGFSLALAFSQRAPQKNTHDPSLQWWKGNLHTHTLWSDGGDYPEMIVEWYKSHSYHFLTLSDHNTLQAGERWSNIASNKAGVKGFEKYLARFGTNWVEQRQEDGQRMVRLKQLNEFRPLFDEPKRFLLVQSEEISDRHLSAPIHMNAPGIVELLKPQGGTSVVDVIQNNVNAVLEQRKRTGQPMMAHLNHPNFQWALTAEEMMQVRDKKFFEVYNGHRGVRNYGDETHAATERIWDIVLTRRLAELGFGVVYGIATDDAHDYSGTEQTSNPGRGWVMVRAKNLTLQELVDAMEAGEFYSSSGVRLKEVGRTEKVYSVEVDPDPGVNYTIQFIGTRKGYNPANEPVRAANGTPLRVTHRYSEEIGAVLAEFNGPSASYQFKGDEIYVRAKVVSSKLQSNPYKAGDFECAWTQPVVPGGRK